MQAQNDFLNDFCLKILPLHDFTGGKLHRAMALKRKSYDGLSGSVYGG